MSQTWQARLNKAWQEKDKQVRVKTEIPQWAYVFEKEVLSGRFVEIKKKLRFTDQDLSSEMFSRKMPLAPATCGRWLKGDIGFKQIKADKLTKLKVFMDMVHEMEEFVEDMENPKRRNPRSSFDFSLGTPLD